MKLRSAPEPRGGQPAPAWGIAELYRPARVTGTQWRNRFRRLLDRWRATLAQPRAALASIAARGAPTRSEAPTLRVRRGQGGSLCQAHLFELDRALEQVLRPNGTGQIVQLLRIGQGRSFDLASDFVGAISAQGRKKVLLVSDAKVVRSAGVSPAPPGPPLGNVLEHRGRGRSRELATLDLAHIDAWLSATSAYGMPCVWEMARQEFDLIVVDSSLSESALSIASHLDGTLLVADSDTARHRALSARDAVMRAGGNLLGIVLTRERLRLPTWLDSLLT